MTKYFLCAARQDANIARDLCAALQNKGHTVWLEQFDFSPGQDWWQTVSMALTDSDVVLLLLSDHSLASHAIWKQCDYARAHQKEVVLVLLRPVSRRLVAEFPPEKGWLDGRSSATSAVIRWLSGNKSLRVKPLPTHSDFANRLKFKYPFFIWLGVILGAALIGLILAVFIFGLPILLKGLSELPIDDKNIQRVIAGLVSEPEICAILALILSLLVVLMLDAGLSWPQKLLSRGIEALEEQPGRRRHAQPGQGLRFFISYSRQDFPAAHRLYQQLAALGHEPWLDLVDIPPRFDWKQEINRAIDSSDVFCLLATPWSLNSAVVREEYLQAKQRPEQPGERPNRILFLILDSLEPADVFNFFQQREEILRPRAEHYRRYLDQHDHWPELEWLDMRQHPLRVSRQLLDRLEQTPPRVNGAFPVSDKATSFFNPFRPAVVQFTAAAFIICGGLGIGLCAEIAAAAVQAALVAPPLSLISKFAITAYFIGAIFLAGFEFASIQDGFDIISRRRSADSPADSLRAIVRAELVFLFLTVLFIVIEYGLRTVEESSFAFSLATLMQLSGLTCVLAAVKVIITRFTAESRTLKVWIPSYTGIDLDRAALRKAYEETKKTEPESKAPSNAPPRQILHPLTQVALVSAHEDRAYAARLADHLRQAGVRIEQRGLDLSRLPEYKSEAVILLLSPWLVRAAGKRQDWLRTQEGAPIIPLRIADVSPDTLPAALREMNWIANADASAAARKLVPVLQGVTPLAGEAEPLKAPSRSTKTTMVVPPETKIAEIPIVTSSVLKICYAFFAIQVLWSGKLLTQADWLAVLILFIAGNVQFIVLLSLLRRGVSWEIALATQGASILLLTATAPTQQAIMIGAGHEDLIGILSAIAFVAEVGAVLSYFWLRDYAAWLPRGLIFEHPWRQYACYTPFIFPAISLVVFLGALLPVVRQLFPFIGS